MTCSLGLLMVLAALGVPDAHAARAARFEILIFDEMPGELGLILTAEECRTRMRSATWPGARFLVGAADVESYIWKTQRITLTREASARLDAAALKIIPDRGSPTDPDRVRWMRDHVFEVRLNGKLLYGGFFTSPWSGRTCPFPVIHPEWVEGQFVFYLLPVNMFPGELGELEETVGASTFWMRLAHRLAPRVMWRRGA
jgi:hypothetical protein